MVMDIITADAVDQTSGRGIPADISRRRGVRGVRLT
jgi:hypothetical protein